MSSGLLALYAMVRGVIYIGLLLLVGTQVAGLLLRHERRELAASLHDRLDRLPRWILATLIVAMLVRGLFQLLSLLDPGDTITLDLVRNALLTGSWGHAWLLQVVGTAVALGAVRYRGDRAVVPDQLTIAAVVVILWAQTGMGHAAGDTWPDPLGRVVDLMHLSGVGLWLGTLAVVLFAALPLLHHPSRLASLALLVRNYSIYARTGAALVLTSGVTAALVYTRGSIRMIPQSTWGRLLLVKLACMVGVLALGWYNWRIVTPALEGQHPNCTLRLRRAIRIELALGLAMLAITTVLVASPLPGEN